MATFQQKLDEHIQAKGISPGKLARHANVDQSYIYKILSGDRKPPSRDVILRIAKALGLKFQEEANLLILAGFAPNNYVEALSYSKGEKLIGDLRNESVRELKNIIDEGNLTQEDYEELIEYFKEKRKNKK